MLSNARSASSGLGKPLLSLLVMNTSAPPPPRATDTLADLQCRSPRRLGFSVEALQAPASSTIGSLIDSGDSGSNLDVLTP